MVRPFLGRYGAGAQRNRWTGRKHATVWSSAWAVAATNWRHRSALKALLEDCLQWCVGLGKGPSWGARGNGTATRDSSARVRCRHASFAMMTSFLPHSAPPKPREGAASNASAREGVGDDGPSTGTCSLAGGRRAANLCKSVSHVPGGCKRGGCLLILGEARVRSGGRGRRRPSPSAWRRGPRPRRGTGCLSDRLSVGRVSHPGSVRQALATRSAPPAR